MEIKMDHKETYFAQGDIKLHLQAMPLVFNYTALKKFVGHKMTDLHALFRDLSDWVLKTLNSNLLNHVSIRFSNIYGEEFIIGIHQKEIIVWSYTGHDVLFKTTSEFFTEDVYVAIVETMDNWSRGYIYCSDCGEKIHMSEIAGKYFAGNYCKECWEYKWKAIEKNETYD